MPRRAGVGSGSCDRCQGLRSDNAVCLYSQELLRLDDSPFSAVPDPIDQALCYLLVFDFVCLPGVPEVALEHHLEVLLVEELHVLFVYLAVSVLVVA